MLEDKFEELLLDYDLEDILADNDLTVAEALAILYRGGYIVAPETTALTLSSSPFDEDISPEDRIG